MNPLTEHRLLVNRRQLLRPAPASARRRWRRCSMTTDAARGEPATADCPACRTSRPRPSASSTCSSPARRRRSICSTTSRSSTELHGTELPDSIRKGQRLTGMTATQDRAFPSRRRSFKFAQHGQSGRVAQRTAAAHGASRRRAVLHQVDAHRGDQSRPGDHVLPDRRAARRAGRASARGSATAWAARTRTCRRSSCMISHGTRQPERSAALRPPLGQRLSAVAASGRQVPLRRRSGAVSVESRRASTRRRAAGMLDDLAQLNQMQLDEIGDPEIATRIAQYEMAFRMQTSRAGADRPVERAASTSSSCTAPRRASPARSPPTACSPAGWPSAACASSSSSIAAGTSTRNLPKQIRRPVPRHRSADAPR